MLNLIEKMLKVFIPPFCSSPIYLPYSIISLQVMPDPSLNSFFFWNSGAEAVEGALKLARYW